MAGGETSGGLPLVAVSEVFSEEEAICVMWVKGSDTMKDKRMKRERCEEELQKYVCLINRILLHHGLIYYNPWFKNPIIKDAMNDKIYT